MKNKVLIVILTVLFITLGVLCLNDYTKTIDNTIYNLVIKIKCDSITNVMKFISFMFSTIMVIIYCILGIFIYKNKNNSIFLCMIMASEALINNITKLIFQRNRPSLIALVTEKSFSFPSGHTMAVVVFMFAIGCYLKEKYNNRKNVITCIQIIMIFLVATSRIYLGAHYFTDIIGAILLSLIIILIVKDSSKINKWLKEGKI